MLNAAAMLLFLMLQSARFVDLVQDQRIAYVERQTEQNSEEIKKLTEIVTRLTIKIDTSTGMVVLTVGLVGLVNAMFQLGNYLERKRSRQKAG
jgi:flagellar biosynthesis protein FlhB